jgi:hypothetical protein
VKTRVDERVRQEVARFAFRFACEDCAHAQEEDGLRCSLGYPAGPRRTALRETHLEFCKAFELG